MSVVLLAPPNTSRLCRIWGWDGGCLFSSFQSSRSRIDLSDVKVWTMQYPYEEGVSEEGEFFDFFIEECFLNLM